MHELKYLAGYSEKITTKVKTLIADNRLGSVLKQRYPHAHDIRTEKALYSFTLAIKNEFLRLAPPISKVTYDPKLHVLHDALGVHAFISRVQGARLKAKHEIKISAVFRNVPLEFLTMIVVHELAHVKTKEHSKAFYQLCEYMEPRYHQLELDTRLYLTYADLGGPQLWETLAHQ